MKTHVILSLQTFSDIIVQKKFVYFDLEFAKPVGKFVKGPFGK